MSCRHSSESMRTGIGGRPTRFTRIFICSKRAPEYVVILAGDHIYKMNYQAMMEFHIAKRADVTIGALIVDRRAASSFGVMQVDESDRLVGFEEKPLHPKSLPGEVDQCMASMGIYLFDSRFLFEQLCRDANNPTSSHDFGKDILPSIIESQRVFAYRFRDENRKCQAYWRDVGTLDAFYQANMDLISVDPLLNMYDDQWPIRTHQIIAPPPKFVFGSSGDSERMGHALDSVACHGCIISGGTVERSLLGSSVRVNSYAQISDSILFDRVEIGRHAKVRRAIIDKGVSIPAGVEIGYDLELDRKRGFTITEGGIVVIAKGEAQLTSHYLCWPPLRRT